MHRDRRPPRGGLIRKLVRGVSGGVGLVSESIHAHNASKAAQKAAASDKGSSSSAVADGEDHSGEVGDEFEAPPPGYSEPNDDAIDPEQYPDEKAVHGHAPGEEVDVAAGDHIDAEDEWNLDDAQDGIIGESSMAQPMANAAGIEDEFIRNHPPPSYSDQSQKGQLSLPVIIPQRRPKTRMRGFIRAYAPMLGNCGIDQNTWLSFLDTFNKSSMASPWLNAINLAGFATMAIPSPVIGFAIGYAIQQATKIAIELQGRERTSNALRKYNEEFFQPRGLFCMVMTWMPESTQRVEQVNLTATITSRSNPSTGIAGIPSKLRSSDGKTYGDYEFPEAAPLVFPALDELAAGTSAENVKKKNNMAAGAKFIMNYWDRRATAEYASAHPDSVLATGGPPTEFKSRYADPNNPAASGSLVSFATGGHLVPNPGSRGLIGGLFSVAGQAVRGEKQGSGWDQNSREQYNKTQYYGQKAIRGRGGSSLSPIGAYKRLVKQNVLYLLVVNMPSEEELAATTISA